MLVQQPERSNTFWSDVDRWSMNERNDIRNKLKKSFTDGEKWLWSSGTSNRSAEAMLLHGAPRTLVAAIWHDGLNAIVQVTKCEQLWERSGEFPSTFIKIAKDRMFRSDNQIPSLAHFTILLSSLCTRDVSTLICGPPHRYNWTARRVLCLCPTAE